MPSDLTRVPVIVSIGRGLHGPIYLLTYAEPCVGCGLRHQHGGGPVVPGEPMHEPGTRVIHCASYHRPFSDDCRRDRHTPYCSVKHVPPTTVVELYVAETSE